MDSDDRKTTLITLGAFTYLTIILCTLITSTREGHIRNVEKDNNLIKHCQLLRVSQTNQSTHKEYQCVEAEDGE